MSRCSRMFELALCSAFASAAVAHARINARRTANALCSLLVGVVLLGAFSSAQADCMRDRNGRVICDRGQCVRNSYGKVYCSRYEDGTALKNLYGEVLCGKGQCVRTFKGDILCAARPGGAAMKDSYGKVTCEGGCERASIGWCGQSSDTVR